MYVSTKMQLFFIHQSLSVMNIQDTKKEKRKEKKGTEWRLKCRKPPDAFPRLINTRATYGPGANPTPRPHNQSNQNPGRTKKGCWNRLASASSPPGSHGKGSDALRTMRRWKYKVVDVTVTRGSLSGVIVKVYVSEYYRLK